MDDGIAYVGENGGDGALNVKFYKRTYNGEECDFISIIIPGDKNHAIDTIATDHYKARYKAKWDEYQGFISITGTPVSEWTDIPESMRDEFAHQGFKYIEQVAGASDASFIRIHGGTQWRMKAQSFLNRGKVAESEIIKRQSEELAELKEQMAMLMKANGMEEPAKRGRKPKETQE